MSQDPFGLPGDPVAQAGPWLLWKAPFEHPQAPAWAAAFEAFFPAAAADLQERWPLPPGVVGHVVLAGEQACLDWGVDEDALGFHALCTSVSHPETGDLELDLPADHRCYVNLSGLQTSVSNDRADDATLLAALATLPHEMAHVALFARHTAGKTPLEVFDDGGGESALHAALAAMEDEATADAGASHHEDVVEDYARVTVDRWEPSGKATLQALRSVFAAAPPTPRRWRR